LRAYFAADRSPYNAAYVTAFVAPDWTTEYAAVEFSIHTAFRCAIR
jgi:hypothetical protein